LLQYPSHDARHPLLELRDRVDNSAAASPQAVDTLISVLKQTPPLLQAGNTSLPCLDLAAGLSPTAGTGGLATRIMLIAGQHRANPDWWRALLASIDSNTKPPDNPDHALLTLYQWRHTLAPEERSALTAACTDRLPAARFTALFPDGVPS